MDALTSYQRAAADSCKVVFWNTSRVMKDLGGMPTFVSNGWAAKDYTHINYAGGKRIANALTEAICQRVYTLLLEQEEAARIEAERQAELERQQALEAELRLNNMVNAVTPIIDSVGWPTQTSRDYSEE